MDNHQPIGVFDSGVGGLSVLYHVHHLLPSERLLYVADSACMPYGSQSPETIRERSRLITRFFVEQGAKAVVVACNTATAAAIESLREAFSIPIIGMEPAVKPAVETTRVGVIGVLATGGTLASEKFSKLVARFDSHAEVVFQPGTGLVEQVEAGELESERTVALLQKHLLPLIERGVDTVVLGCTHYPFLAPVIRKIVGENVAVLDTGDAIAAELKRQLERSQQLAVEGRGHVSFFSSGDIESVEPMISRLWGRAVQVQQLKIG
ncbi:MAG TPA: glutamate racemase [Mariprofundaceae bacterium]|nr:glutamate racemase [Mariprofundaceae bacterium]